MRGTWRRKRNRQADCRRGQVRLRGRRRSASSHCNLVIISGSTLPAVNRQSLARQTSGPVSTICNRAPSVNRKSCRHPAVTSSAIEASLTIVCCSHISCPDGGMAGFLRLIVPARTWCGFFVFRHDCRFQYRSMGKTGLADDRH